MRHLTEQVEEQVVLEYMPDHNRSSHRTGSWWGRYPANGACRCVVARSEAEQYVEGDEDAYDSIVRAATEEDVAEYDAGPTY